MGSQPIEEQLSDSKKHIQELTETLNAALAEIDTLRTHCYFAGGVISCQQKQLFLRDNKKRSSRHVKKTNDEARVLTAGEGHQQLQQLQEEAELKEQLWQQEVARKAADDEARRKRWADHTHTFTGSLNRSKRKGELEDIAVALALPETGKKDDIFERISRHFEQHPELKRDAQFEGLFNLRPTKRPRTGDAPVVGPSSLQDIAPSFVPSFSPSLLPPYSGFASQPNIGPMSSSSTHHYYDPRLQYSYQYHNS
ncbi:hypothetical protein EDB84DRAFT_1271110 [Lactarius hengduanensis]|nr:hypothetical protein EDB84DRAFT_1271110 [Lactarius hengduanensis]